MYHSLKPLGFVFIIIMCCFSISFSQDRQYTDDLDLHFEQSAFEGRFCVLVEDLGDANYYVIDQTQLQGDFSKVYFLNLVYSDNKIVNIDPGVGEDQMWFKANIAYPPEEIICLLDDLRTKTLETDTTMDPSEKEAWLDKHNKFKTKK